MVTNLRMDKSALRMLSPRHHDFATCRHAHVTGEIFPFIHPIVTRCKSADVPEDRKAILAAVNAILSRTGVATWWASGGIRVESPLGRERCHRPCISKNHFMIWRSRKGPESKNVRRRTKIKKDGGDGSDTDHIPVLDIGMALYELGLRHRATVHTDN